MVLSIEKTTIKTYQSIAFFIILILLPVYATNTNATTLSLVTLFIKTIVRTQLTNRNHREQATIVILAQEQIEWRHHLIGLAREHEACTQRLQLELLTSLNRLGSVQRRLFLLR